MMNVTKAFQQMLESAEQNKDDSAQIVNPVVGQVVAQGDVNFLILPDIPKGAEPAIPNRQLVPGVSRGSRHCIAQDDMDNVDFFAYPDPNSLEGPILRFNKQVRIEHPEHGDQIWPAGTIVQVGYQRRYAAVLKRIQD